MEQRIVIPVPGAGSVSAALAGKVSARAVLLAHGAGAGMDSDFMRLFSAGLVERGFFTGRFNFPYVEAGRTIPDARRTLETCFRVVADFISQLLRDDLGQPAVLVLGGKSMGGRIASHLAAAGYPAAGLLFLGYPLHPPGKPEQMRDSHLSEIHCPMLLLSGTRDAFAQRELLEPVVERLSPQARVAWIEGGDHSWKVKGRSQRQVYEEALDIAAAWLAELRVKSEE